MFGKAFSAVLTAALLMCTSACARTEGAENTGNTSNTDREENVLYDTYTTSTPIVSVLSDPAFGNYGRLIFPVDEWYYSGDTLGTLSMTWYTHIDPNKTVEICNYLKSHAERGERIFSVWTIRFLSMKRYTR